MPDDGRPELDVAYRAARTDTERALTRIWTDVLQLADIGVDDPFLEIGGDSLRAAEIALRVRIRFAALVSVADLMASATIAAMAVLLDARRKSPRSP
jgi:nonribosomal peptide synthetase DhbF